MDSKIYFSVGWTLKCTWVGWTLNWLDSKIYFSAAWTRKSTYSFAWTLKPTLVLAGLYKIYFSDSCTLKSTSMLAGL